MNLITRSVAPVGTMRARHPRSAARVIAAESFASVLEQIEPAAPSGAVARGPNPVVVCAAAPRDRAVLAQFLADLAAAPDIVGELLALYIEQHPRLAIWFTARAVMARSDAVLQLEAAARWRETCGAQALAELIRAALAIACPPPDPMLRPPPVIVDLGLYADLDDDADWSVG